MRDFNLVAEAIKKELPEDYNHIKFEIEQIEYDGMFLAPERRRELWFQLMNTLEKNLPNPFTGPPWAKKIGKIIRGEKKGFYHDDFEDLEDE